MINIQLSKNLRNLRASIGWSQEALAKEMNMSRQAYAAYETGERSPSSDTLIWLARFYHVTVDQLLTENIVPGRPGMVRENPNLNYMGRTEENGTTPKILYMSAEEQNMVCLARDLTPDEFHTVYTLLETLAANHKPVKGSLKLEE